jgi:hypothetical protein
MGGSAKKERMRWSELIPRERERSAVCWASSRVEGRLSVLEWAEEEGRRMGPVCSPLPEV